MAKFKFHIFYAVAFFSLASVVGCNAIEDEDDSDDDHHVFVTSGAWTGNISGPDTRCQAAADAAGLDKTYRAIVSTSLQDAADHISVDNGGAVYIADNLGSKTTVDNSIAALFDGNLLVAITKDENGNEITGNREVFTGSNISGAGDDVSGDYCLNWTDATTGNPVRVGTATEINNEWISDQGASWECDNSARLYCISQ